MKTQFELKNWMTENRETVISKYEELTKEEFFNGISMRDFMVKVMNTMVMNNVRSAKRAANMLPSIMENIYYSNCEIQVVNDLDAKMKSKYEGTAYMALV